MEALVNNVSVTTFNNFLYSYNNLVTGKDIRLENLLDKLTKFINTDNVTVDNLTSLLTNLNNDMYIKSIVKDNTIVDDESYISDMRKLSDLLKFYPTSIHLTVHEDGSGYLFANNKSFFINKSLVDMLKSDTLTAMSILDYKQVNILREQGFNIITTNEAYKVDTTLLNLLKCDLPIADIRTLDLHDNFAYIYLNLPYENIDILNTNIINMHYVSKGTVDIEPWVATDLFNIILTTKLDDLKYSISRKFTSEVKKVNKTYGKIPAYNVAIDILASYWRDGILSNIIKDFPFLQDITKMTEAKFIKILGIGIKGDINTVNYNTHDVHNTDIDQLLNQLQTKLNALS